MPILSYLRFNGHFPREPELAATASELILEWGRTGEGRGYTYEYPLRINSWGVRSPAYPPPRFRRPWLASYIGAKNDEISGDNWSYKTFAKLQSNRHHQQTNTQLFYRPDALPVTTNSVRALIQARTGHCAIVSWHRRPPPLRRTQAPLAPSKFFDVYW